MVSKRLLLAGGVALSIASLAGIAVTVRHAHHVQREDEDDIDSAAFAQPIAPAVVKFAEAKGEVAMAVRAKDQGTDVAAVAEVVPIAEVGEEAAQANNGIDAKVDRKDEEEVQAAANVTTNAADLLDEALQEVIATESVTAAAVTTTALATPAEASKSDDGVASMSRLGLSLKLPPGWEANQEFSPSPNIVIITITNPSLGEPSEMTPPGNIPIIALTAEDVHMENLNLQEFNERSKDVSLQQLLMLTGGAVHPVVRRDEVVHEGPFRRILEYAQYVPPFLDLTVVSLSEMRNGVAYVLQITCNSAALNHFRPVFMQMARDLTLTTIPTDHATYLRVQTGSTCAHIDTAWGWDAESQADAEVAGKLAIFHHLSSVKKETLTLYALSALPSYDGQPRETKTYGGTTIKSYFDGTRERKVATCGDYALVVEPQQKAISYIADDALVACIESVRPSTLPASLSFVNTEQGYSFVMVGGSQVVCSPLNKNTAIYIPQGSPRDLTVDTEPENRGPLVTIRVGTPADEPDCMGSIEEWKTRVEADESIGEITNLREVSLKNTRCLTFMSKAMQEMGPNMRTEMKECVHIFVRNGVSTVIRWETVSGQWRKFERQMNAFIDSFLFL